MLIDQPLILTFDRIKKQVLVKVRDDTCHCYVTRYCCSFNRKQKNILIESEGRPPTANRENIIYLLNKRDENDNRISVN